MNRSISLDRHAMVPSADAGRAAARDARDRGYDGLFLGEGGYDVFLALGSALDEAGDELTIGSSIAVALARTPMTVAYPAHDLQGIARGRFVLGLGTQIRAHVTRRFGMPWSQPAARMREFVHALRAIWDAWATNEKLDFRGDFYEHTLMSPPFSPTPHEFGMPAVALAAVGPIMTRVAGEVADLFLAHPFTTPDYLTEVSLPNLATGAKAAGRTPADVQITVSVMVVTGTSENERDAAATLARQQIAFYASTPAYLRVLERHGLEELHQTLHPLSKQGRWAEMAELIDDDVLTTFAVVTDAPADVGPALKARWGDIADRIQLYPTWTPRHAQVAAIRSTLSDTHTARAIAPLILHG